MQWVRLRVVAVRVVVVALGVAVGVAGCGQSDSAIDAAADAPTDAAADAPLSELTCGELAAQLAARLQSADRSCTAPNQCSSVGYPVRSDNQPTCGCGIGYASSCGGDAVNHEAWQADGLAMALVGEWETRCVPQGCGAPGAPIWDEGCGPGAVDCVGYTCTSSVLVCGDAGVR